MLYISEQHRVNVCFGFINQGEGRLLRSYSLICNSPFPPFLWTVIFLEIAPGCFSSEVATRATKSSALVKSFSRWSYVWPSVLLSPKDQLVVLIMRQVSSYFLQQISQSPGLLWRSLGSELCVSSGFNLPASNHLKAGGGKTGEWSVYKWPGSSQLSSLEITVHIIGLVQIQLGQIDSGVLLSEMKILLFPYQCPLAWILGIKHLMEDGPCSEVK